MSPSTDNEFVTIWQLEAPIEEVWEELYRPERWPQWWKGVESVAELRAGDESGVGVQNARKVRLIYGGKRKTDKLDAEHLGDASPGWTPSCSLRSSTETKPLRRTWHSYAHARRSSALARS